MPYNNAPIAPSKEVTGQISLPLARVKKIIATDDDIGACSNNAAFCIAVATELFLQHLVRQAHKVVKSERKPRRNIQYKDIANAVARIDNLEFLSDVAPRTMTFRQYKEKKTTQDSNKTHESLVNGQRTLEEMRGRGGDDEDSEMHDVSMGNGYRNQSFSSNSMAIDNSLSRSPTATRPSGHKFDAVRNEMSESTSMDD